MDAARVRETASFENWMIVGSTQPRCPERGQPGPIVTTSQRARITYAKTRGSAEAMRLGRTFAANAKRPRSPGPGAFKRRLSSSAATESLLEARGDECKRR
jgi:hypothetical protein